MQRSIRRLAMSVAQFIGECRAPQLRPAAQVRAAAGRHPRHRPAGLRRGPQVRARAAAYDHLWIVLEPGRACGISCYAIDPAHANEPPCHHSFPHQCRLKSAQGNKTISALLSLNCPRRILLTGTPIQNNLQVGRAAAGAAGTQGGLGGAAAPEPECLCQWPAWRCGILGNPALS